MKRYGVALSAILATAAVACTDQAPMGPSAEEIPASRVSASPATASYIVVVWPDVKPRSVLAISGVHPRHIYEHSIRGFAAELTRGQVTALGRNAAVQYVEPDGVVQLRPPCHAQRGRCVEPERQSAGGRPQVVPWGVARVGGPRDGTGKRAWVLDTGIDLSHPDLNVDVALSVSFMGDGNPDDLHGHGTHVAGTISAIDNDIGVVGVAAGATLVSVRVLGADGMGTWSTVIAGVDHVAANAAPGDVANLSLGAGAHRAADAAVQAAAARGIWFVIAAGNGRWNAADRSPARATGDFVRTVSAIGRNDCLTSWSNWGNPPIDYAQPGERILSSAVGGGTEVMSGTSMAAPHLAGILLLGEPSTDGVACKDPDGFPDPIAVF